MSHQITKVDLIPNGELSVCNVSQFDNGRVLPFEILENKEAYNIPNDIRVELHCRKPDGNIVTLPSESISNNIVTFLSTTQLTACYGKNICEIALYGPDDYLIGSCNFILDVEKSPTLGGINSTSDIHNLEEQIEEITTEIVGENYYNKSEVDGLLADKANTADVYTKSQVDSALALKANAADVYTKSQVDSALALKANAADVYTKQEVDNIIMDIMPVDTASGTIATFDTEISTPLVNVSCNIVATGGNGTPNNPIPINGYTEANITRCGVNLFDGSKVITTNTSNWGVSFENDNLAIEHKTAYSTGVPTIDFNLFGTFTISFTATQNNKCSLYENGSYKQLLNSGTQFTATRGNTYFIVFSAGDNTTNIFSNVQIETGNTASEYHSYNGQTVPVADATTLITLSGINNVFADSGNVTVQYKYMSM